MTQHHRKISSSEKKFYKKIRKLKIKISKLISLRLTHQFVKKGNVPGDNSSSEHRQIRELNSDIQMNFLNL